jgi:hypothetical protein
VPLPVTRSCPCFFVVIPEGDLLLPLLLPLFLLPLFLLPLFLLPLFLLPLFLLPSVLAVVLSASEGPRYRSHLSTRSTPRLAFSETNASDP